MNVKTPFHDDAASALFKVGRADCRFIEDHANNGFRLVGMADKLARLSHNGWYADTFEDALIRGAVFQVTGKSGQARVFPGYIRDDDYGAVICMTPESVDSLERDQMGLRGVAYAADRLAEIAAEDSREYDRAWQAGARYASNREEIDALRIDMRETAQALRDNPTGPRKVQAVLQERIGKLRADVYTKLAHNEKLKAGEDETFYFSPSSLNAFMDCAQIIGEIQS